MKIEYTNAVDVASSVLFASFILRLWTVSVIYSTAEAWR